MHTRFYIVAALAIILSFVGGFLVANSLNKAEIANLRASLGPAEKQETPSGLELPEKEIRQKLSEASDNPKNFSFQKNLGLALYRYAASKKDTKLLTDVEELLERAHGLNPDDYEVLVSLANLNFDLGQIEKDPARVVAAREFYEKALKKNPKDSNVIADLGFSYLEGENPEPEKAIASLEMAYSIDPGSERILSSLSYAYLKMNDSAKASEYLVKLKKLNPQNQDITRIESEIKTEASQ